MTDFYCKDALFSPRELAARFDCSEKKLASDRGADRGVRFIKIGRLCRYRLSDILAYEERHLCRSTSDFGGSDV